MGFCCPNIRTCSREKCRFLRQCINEFQKSTVKFEYLNYHYRRENGKVYSMELLQVNYMDDIHMIENFELPVIIFVILVCDFFSLSFLT